MSVFTRSGFDAEFRRSPLRLVDVGASGGIDDRWREAAPFLNVVGFDADARATAGPDSSPKMTYLNMALNRQKGPVTFHLTRKQETSSIFAPNRAWLDRFPESERFDIVETATVDADTLDAQLAAAGVADADFVKIDAQGAELAILQGGVETVRDSVIGLELEVEFAEIYTGQPLFTDVDAFAREQGFVLFDLRPYYWKRRAGQHLGGPRGQLVFGEALYLRDLPSLWRIVTSRAGVDAQRSKALRALGVCWLYGYLDYAAEILEMSAPLFSAEEMKRLRGSLDESPDLSARVPNFRGRARIESAFDRLTRVFASAYRGWAAAGRRLGNR